MSVMKRIARLTSTYMLGELLVMAGGFISFPIFTRILTLEEYGIMSMVSITLGLVDGFFSIGLRHAAQRFYADSLQQGEDHRFYVTQIKSSMLFGVAGTLLVVAGGVVLTLRENQAIGYAEAVMVAAPLVFIRIFSKIVGCLYRVREKAGFYALTSILVKYAGMFLAVLMISYYRWGITGFFLGLVSGELLVMLILWIWMIKDFGWPRGPVSWPLFNKMVEYGFPMVISGFASVLLSTGDRYLIGWIMGAEAVASYSVPYNLCSYITSVMVTGFEFAFIPVIMHEWSKGNRALVKMQLEQVIKLYCLMAIPIIFGITAIGHNFIIVLASEKYAASSVILPFVITGELLKGLFTPLVIGLQFYKQTKVITKVTWLVVLINCALNLILIPWLGVVGAAVATLASYLFLLIIGTAISNRHFHIQLPLKSILLYAMNGFLMFIVVKSILTSFTSINASIPVVVGVVVFLGLEMANDRDFRKMGRQAFQAFGRFRYGARRP